ncbi:MAG: copper resistance CopC family protein, partial [bacterium]
MTRMKVVACVALALLFGARGTAYAHATLVKAEPGAGLRLDACPARVWLLFSEDLEPSLARIAIVGRDGRSTPLVVSGDPHDVHAVLAPMQCLGAGAYRVTWRVVSADGHPVAGSYEFSIGSVTALAPKAGAPPSLGDAEVDTDAKDMHAQFGPSVFEAPLVPAVFRGLALGALMALAGLLFFQQQTAASRSGAGDRLTVLLAWLAALLLATHFALWIMNADANHQL